MTPRCAGLCGEPITGTPIRDDGDVWHPWCRRQWIAERARRRAEELLAADPEVAAVVAGVQRAPVGRSSAIGPLVVTR